MLMELAVMSVLTKISTEILKEGVRIQPRTKEDYKKVMILEEENKQYHTEEEKLVHVIMKGNVEAITAKVVPGFLEEKGITSENVKSMESYRTKGYMPMLIINSR